MADNGIFTFEEMLTRRHDFTGDVREAGMNAHGGILKISMIGEQSGNWCARLLITDCCSKYVLTVIVFFKTDPDTDIIIIPEFKMACRFRRHPPGFSTMNMLYTIGEVDCIKTSDPDMHEYKVIAATAAVCAVYERCGYIGSER
jgi:hypothetical protein